MLNHSGAAELQGGWPLWISRSDGCVPKRLLLALLRPGWHGRRNFEGTDGGLVKFVVVPAHRYKSGHPSHVASYVAWNVKHRGTRRWYLHVATSAFKICNRGANIHQYLSLARERLRGFFSRKRRDGASRTEEAIPVAGLFSNG